MAITTTQEVGPGASGFGCHSKGHPADLHRGITNSSYPSLGLQATQE